MPSPGSETAFDDGVSGNEKHSARIPACDLCREKKVRCGREKPKCQNCVVWKSSCTYSERQKRDNEASRNAQRFEEVNERLDRIESTMARLVTALESAQLRSTPAPTPTPAARSRNRTRAPQETEAKNLLVANKQGDLQFLGPSSLLSITSEAETLLEERLKASEATGSAAGRAEQSEAIGALRKLSNISSKSANFFLHYGHKELRTGAENAGMGMPPREEADLLVNEFFSKIHHWFPIFDEAQFRLDVDSFYKNPEILGKDRAWQACFNNVLLFGLHNQLATMTAEEKKRKNIDENDKRVSTFFFNAWSAIDDLEVFITPRLRNVQALMSASVCAIEVSRPGLCWSLLSQAASTAQAIGLHRKSSPSKYITTAQLEERKYVFWNVYILDKCLSLSFGRSPCLPDYDCDVEMPEPDGDRPFYQSFLALLALSKVQSEIYMRLYSASASRQTEEERERAIKDLDSSLRVWWSEWSQIFSDPRNSAVDSFEHIELRFSYHNSMTLVHRMARPGMPSYGWSDEQCLENSRAAIRMINGVVAEGSEVASSGMLLWLFQYYPFTSFFVLFSAIIRNPSAPSSSTTDYPLMKGLVSYLSTMKSQNEGASKLLSIASAFTHVAGTFLKNYLKMTKHPRSSAPHKRRREEPPAPPPVEDVWIHQPTTATTTYYPPQLPPPQVFVSTPSTDDTDPGPGGIVDLQPASFLRWPATVVPEPPPTTATEEEGAFDIDLEALMEEPGGFQMQMAQAAAVRGPLEFDWFSWDGQFGL
ncbi:hypothetical protein K440DRAFT_614442 [Wilcoxina mikolae CBS 423.85]|nr:hypothetical protein K440DRAFT_614442 [Wilcoxina mikolae CBS 423.85]